MAIVATTTIEILGKLNADAAGGGAFQLVAGTSGSGGGPAGALSAGQTANGGGSGGAILIEAGDATFHPSGGGRRRRPHPDQPEERRGHRERRRLARLAVRDPGHPQLTTG